MPTLPANLPEETIELYRGYLADKVLTKSEIQEQVTTYLKLVEKNTSGDEFIDLSTARSIAEGLLTLLQGDHDEHLEHIQAAAIYFIRDDDAEPDFESILGFEDDAQVFNAVCHHLGRPELEIVL